MGDNREIKLQDRDNFVSNGIEDRKMVSLRILDPLSQHFMHPFGQILMWVKDWFFGLNAKYW